jgi:hypothetical protein
LIRRPAVVCAYHGLVRRLVAVSLTLGLAAAGAQLAHALTYRLVEPDAHARDHLLAETGHSYLELAPMGLAVVLALVTLGLLWEAAGVRAGRRGAPLRPALFLAAAPATFVLQEHLERLLHDGAFPWTAVAEPTFVLGLLLQLPFALAAYAAGRLLLRAARAVGLLLAATPHRRRADRLRLLPRAALVPRSLRGACSLGPRAPPLPSS